MHARPLMTAGLAALLEGGAWQVSRHDRDPAALAAADLLLTDYASAIEDGLAAPRPPQGCPVLVVTRRDGPVEVRRALQSPVAGYLLDTLDAAQLHHAVRLILGGARYFCPGVLARVRVGGPHTGLTERENEVLRLLAQGLCNKRIARDLGIGVGTVKWHVHGLMGKLGASARTQAVVMAVQRGLVGIGTPAPR